MSKSGITSAITTLLSRRAKPAAKISAALVLAFAIYAAYASATQPTATSLPSPSPTSLAEAARESTVTEVVDGDTIKVLLDGTVKTVRLIGVDTPETVAPNHPVECFGAEASARTKELLLGKQVTLTADPTQDDIDRYGRLLRYVVADGADINGQLIAEGYAYEYTYDKAYQHQASYKAAQKGAQIQAIGLWAPNGCNGKR